MDKTCNTCHHRNAHGICTNAESVYFGSRVDDNVCPVWENYDYEFWGDEYGDGYCRNLNGLDNIAKEDDFCSSGEKAN